MMPGDPVVGGITLRRPAIASPNYAAGAAGWSINADGSAEFNNATVRGTVTAATIIGALIESAAAGRRTTLDSNGDIKVYNSSGAVLFWFDNADNAQFCYADTGTGTQGALTSSVAAAAGTDPFGSAYLAGETAYGAGGPGAVATSMQAGQLQTYTAATAAGPWTQAGRVGTLENDGNLHFGAVGGAFLVTDTILYHLDKIAGTGREAWHDMRPLSNSFVGSVAGRDPPQFRLANDGMAQVHGCVQFPPTGGPNFNSVTFANIPAQYRPPANGAQWPVSLVTNVTPVGTPSVGIDSSGNLQFHGCPASGMANNIAFIDGQWPIGLTGVITS